MQTIMVTTDFSEESTHAFSFAKQYAELRGGAEFVLVSVLEDIVSSSIDFEFGISLFSSDEFQKEIKAEAEKKLEQLAEQHFAGQKVRTRLSSDTRGVSQQLVSVYEEEKADLLVMATHGRTGVQRFLMGSVTEAVLKRVHCPILVVPCGSTPSNESPLKVVVTTDFSEASRRAYPLGAELYRSKKCQLTLLHIIEDITRGTFGFALGERSQEIQHDLREKYQSLITEEWGAHFPNTLIETAVVEAAGRTEEALVEYLKSHSSHFLVIASQGKGALAEAFLGSMVERTLRTIACPMLVVPA